MSRADADRQAPADFPVVWDYPEDEQISWRPDVLHFPEPVSPLFGVFFRRVMEGGLNRAAEVYELPIRARIRRINGFIYMGITAVEPPPSPEQKARSQEKLRSVMGRLEEIWTTKFLPEIQRDLARWEVYDLRGATMTELLVHLNETVAVITRLYELHFMIWFPFSAALLLFEDLYGELFGHDPAGFYRLLQGFDNKMLEGDRRLWELSRKALRADAVVKAIDRNPPDKVAAALKRTPEGKSFHSKFQNFLKEYGYRSEQVMSFTAPYWIDDPAPAYRLLKQYIHQPDRDLEAEMSDLAAERETHIQKALAHIKDRPDEVRNEFDFLLNAAQEAIVLEQDHTYWIDCRAMYEVRRVLLEFGRRFAEAGAIDAPEDIFYLRKKELREEAERLPGGDLRGIVAERKAEMERFRNATPPGVLGKESEELPDGPVVRALTRFFGGQAPQMAPSV